MSELLNKFVSIFSFEQILRYFGRSRMGPTLEPRLSSLTLEPTSLEREDTDLEGEGL